MFNIRRRSLVRILLVGLIGLAFRFTFTSSSPAASSNEIKKHNVLDLVAGDDKLDVRRHKFLQSRKGRDERGDIMSDIVKNGVDDYWERFQRP
jgi:hypothetical protein